MKTKTIIIAVAIVAAIIYISDKMQKFKPLSHPLKRRKCDKGGCGYFGAPRSRAGTGKAHSHRGQDFLVLPGAEIYAPISGKVRIAAPYEKDPNYSGLEISGKAYAVKMFYLSPTVQGGEYVNEGDLVGYAQDISQKYGSIVPPHIHLEVRVGGVVVDPSPYFPADTPQILT